MIKEKGKKKIQIAMVSYCLCIPRINN